MIEIKYDGINLNEQIRGLHISSVTGRELLGAEIQSYDHPARAGSKLIRRVLPSREITVAFQIQAPTQSAYRIRFNKLSALLNKSEVSLIFSDENDKYFVASSAEMDKNQIVFYCSDPFKYSTVKKSFPATVANGIMTANVENKGTVPVPIDYTIKMNHDNGYVGIVSDQGAMQYGFKGEPDKEYVDNQQLATLANLISAPNDTTGTDALHIGYGHTGTMVTKNWFNTNFLTLGSLGTAQGISWGGMKTFNLPADASGHVGAKNFYCYWHLLFYAGLMGQTGELSLAFLTSDNQLIAGCTWYKWDKYGNTGSYQMVVHGPVDKNGRVNGKILQNRDYQTNHLQHENPWYWDWGHCDLRKEGKKITFYYYGGYYTYIIPEIENMECAKIQVTARSLEGRTGNQVLSMFGFDSLRFEKIGVNTWKDIPNRFSNGGTMTIKGNEGKMYYNGMPRPQDEIVGTKYFMAEPGMNTVEFYYSSFSTPAPTITAEIREAWL